MPWFGLLARGSSSSRAFPPPLGQWPVPRIVAAHSGGAAPDFHRLPVEPGRESSARVDGGGWTLATRNSAVKTASMRVEIDQAQIELQFVLQVAQHLDLDLLARLEAVQHFVEVVVVADLLTIYRHDDVAIDAPTPVLA